MARKNTPSGADATGALSIGAVGEVAIAQLLEAGAVRHG